MSDPTLTYPEAIVIGLLQGVTELFPVSSLGHSVLLPALIGGRWARDLSLTAGRSPYLAFVVAVHVATAVALVWHFRADWVRIVRGLTSSVRTRSVTTADQRLAWLLVAATIPVGLAGPALEHAIRTALGRPVPAAIFLILNGVMLAAVERVRARRRAVRPAGPSWAVGVPSGSARSDSVGSSADPYAPPAHSDRVGSSAHLYASSAADPDERLARQSWAQALLIGAAQILALFPGISRSGATIGAGLVRGLDHEDAARFAFLLATPVILAAGVLKIPELAAPSARGVLGPVLIGSVVAGVAAYVSVRFLTRYFETRTLNPFAVYCVVAGLFSLAWLSL